MHLDRRIYRALSTAITSMLQLLGLALHHSRVYISNAVVNVYQAESRSILYLWLNVAASRDLVTL